MNTILIKEINYTKNGKNTAKGKLKNSIHHLKKSLQHSLRLEDENFNWDKEKSYKNDYSSFGKSEEDIKNNYEKLIENIENITQQKSDGDKKIAKKFSNLKTKIKKRYSCDNSIFELIENNLEYDSEEIFSLISDTYNYKYSKDFQKKQSIEQIETYIKTYSEYLESCYKYKNETIMKEMIFTIPGKDTDEFSEEDEKQIKNILNILFQDFEIDLMIHNDEHKKHYHAFIKGWDKDNNFNLQKKMSDKIEKYIKDKDNYEKLTEKQKSAERQKTLQKLMLGQLNSSYIKNGKPPKFERKKYLNEEEKEFHRKEISNDVDRKLKDRKFNYYTLKEDKLMNTINNKKQVLSHLKVDIDYYNEEIIKYEESLTEKNNLILETEELLNEKMSDLKNRIIDFEDKLSNAEIKLEDKIATMNKIKNDMESLEQDFDTIKTKSKTKPPTNLR